MICPYCAEDIPANSQQHAGCRRIRDKQFPQPYLHLHGDDGSAEPVVLSVVGFPGHGKTVYLCALFDYLDNHLTVMWRDWGFYNHVLDQESLSLLNDNRRKLRSGILPPPTQQSFPRPGIFRLTHMPHSVGGNGLPPLVDTTVLIYDPPGEAFSTEDKIVEFASFVKRSSCVLFLIDLTALGDSMADEMALLLDTYLLGMRRMGIEKKSQHMTVVYTKSDEMKVSVPEFKNFLEQEPRLKDYLDQQRPGTLSDPHAHLRRLADISSLLETFTWSELNAAKFIQEAKDWFASVSYAVVSSLGAAPEERQDGNGNVDKRLAVKMSPRGVADPLLYVLAKSHKEPPTPPVKPIKPYHRVPLWLILTLIGGAAAIILIGLLALFAWSSPETGNTGNGPMNGPTKTTNGTNNTRPPAKAVPAPKGMVYLPGGEFIMGNAGGDDFERPPHRVSVKPFFIDIYEVTCADYARFIEQTGHAPPPGWRGGQYPQGSAQRPVTGVSWDDAVAYAKWANKRLPTEEEWEFAARGTDGRLYPWGKEWQAGMANAGGVANGGLADVGVFKGVSPFGVYDMVGNAWEWTANDLQPYPGGRLPHVPQEALKVIRGGSWQESQDQATATYRGYLLARGRKDYSATGLRCAQDAAGIQVSGTDGSAH
jgi:formylglycine-generating enzyme required for sulfatase activity